jgi:Asp-tRNA(Asn)/Glu-tRNA(Gln) amidotransferase A subunit family amidase
MLRQMLEEIEAGKESAVLERCLRRIREAEPEIQAWLEVAPRQGSRRGPLRGVPFGVKDIFETEGMATEYGSPVYKGRKGRRDAALVAELRRRGAVLVGKTHTTAFAYRDPGPTRNPRNREHTPGGSSSGSAAAVAAGMVPFALGTQTRGSVIRPASFCGVVGFKPTYGLLPTAGLLPLARSLDTAGLFTETAADMRVLWERMGYPAGSGERATLGAADGAGEVEPEMERAFRETVARLREAGLAMETVRLPAAFRELEAVTRRIMEYEGAREHAARFREHGDKLGRLAELVRTGLKLPESDYRRDRETVARAKQEMAAVFRHTPVILTPAAPGPAPRGLGSTGDPKMNAPWTALGTPAVTVPMPVTGLPLGLQITADYGHDARVLEAAVRVERVLADGVTGGQR